MKTIQWIAVVFGAAALAGPVLAQQTPPGTAPASGPPRAAPAPAVPPAAPNQAAAPSQGGTPGDAPNVKVERGAGGKKIYKITTEIRIEGKIQKPEAFYVLQKSAINYQWQELRQDFLPKIVDSVSKAPF